MKYIDFMDMIDGGGPGKMGGKFEGGGLLSLLANAVASPYGSEDEERRKRLMQMRGLLDASSPAAITTTPTPTTVTPPAAPRTAPAPSYATMDMGEAGRGANLGYPLQNIPPAYDYGGNRPMMPMPEGVPSAMTSAMTNPAQDFMLQMVRENVMSMFPTMPVEEQNMRIQQEYQRLMGALGY